jgi:hypothetical protein
VPVYKEGVYIIRKWAYIDTSSAWEGKRKKIGERKKYKFLGFLMIGWG